MGNQDSANASLQRIRDGDEVFLKELYQKNREAFIKWSTRHFNCPEDQAKEAYQKTFTIFYFNIKDQKITELNSSLSTYMFGIGKNVVKKILADKSNSNLSLDQITEPQWEGVTHDEQEEQQYQKTLVKKMLASIGEPCKTVLLLYYFKRYSMESIADRMGYKNEVVAKKKKFLCLQKLKNSVVSLKT